MAETIIIRKWDLEQIIYAILTGLIIIGLSIGIYYVPCEDEYASSSYSYYGPAYGDITTCGHDEGFWKGLFVSFIAGFVTVFWWAFREPFYENIELCKQTRKVS